MNRKLLVVEINEITWDLIDPLIAAGTLPTFARLKREGTWGAPLSVDLPSATGSMDHLDHSLHRPHAGGAQCLLPFAAA